MKNLFLYGSCVSRDSYDFLDRGEFKLLDYVSRQSIISTYGPADPAVLDAADMSSKFQIRNSRGDFVGDLWDRMAPALNDVDLIVWDIIDERNGVVETSDGGYVTFTYDLHRAKVFASMEAAGTFVRRIPFGTDEHFELWCASVDRFYDDLVSRGLADKLRLIVAPWALHADDGGVPNHWALGPTPAEANDLFVRYYDYLTVARGIACIDLPVSAAVTRRDHKWGPASYHYVDSAYEFIVSGIKAAA